MYVTNHFIFMLGAVYKHTHNCQPFNETKTLKIFHLKEAFGKITGLRRNVCREVLKLSSCQETPGVHTKIKDRFPLPKRPAFPNFTSQMFCQIFCTFIIKLKRVLSLFLTFLSLITFQWKQKEGTLGEKWQRRKLGVLGVPKLPYPQAWAAVRGRGTSCFRYDCGKHTQPPSDDEAF